MTKAEIKKAICDAVDSIAEEIVALGEETLATPEFGYKETAASERLKKRLAEMDLPVEQYARTGLKSTLQGGGNTANVALIGELDAVVCFTHPHANKETGAAHACGHHVQQAIAWGAFRALQKSGVMPQLDGSVTFMATPAEEFVEMEFRGALRERGEITWYGGKQQMILEGAFDDIDRAMMLHAHPDTPEAALNLDGDSLGFVAKTIDFYGRAAHGSKPFEGINALNAAIMALMGVHANREIFRDEDHIRIHPIITNGGSIVNSVPDHVRIETYIRGANAQAIADACEVVERCMKGAAMSIGARVEITTDPGYLPLKQSEVMGRVMEENAIALWGEGSTHRGVPTTGSTDIGDLSQLIPCLQPTCGGFTGTLHGENFVVSDPKIAYIDGAKLLALTAADLLLDGAAAAKEVKASYTPAFTKESYLAFLEAQRG